jgi:ubiquinone/menaquinone biosynthesis C-methylase UbiE
MSATPPSISDFWKSPNTARDYEADTGGVTIAITEDLVAHYLETDSLANKMVLDNACGTGIVTRKLLNHTTDITIEAADISEAMIDQFKRYLAAEGWNNVKVTAKVMNAEVNPKLSCIILVIKFI